MSYARPDPDASPHDDSVGVAPPAAPIRFSLRTAFLLIAVIAVILGVGRAFVISARRARTAAIASTHHSYLHMVGLGINCCESVNGFLPSGDVTDANGKVLSSWRFAVSVYADSWNIALDLSAAWSSPTNQPFGGMQNGLYCWNDGARCDTSVFAVTGPDTVFDRTRRKKADVPPDLVLLMEVRDSKIHWMQPGDYNVTDLLAYQGNIGDHLHGLLPDRLHVLFADGEAWALDPNAPIADLQPFLTITGAKSHDRDQLLGPHRVD
jgi:hypothetical protein